MADHDELADRRARALRLCEERDGVDAVVVASPTLLLWMAGIDGWGCYVPQYVVLRRDEAGWVRADAVMRAMDAKAVPEGAVDAVHCYPDDAVDNPTAHPMATALGLLRGCRRIGIDADGPYFRARYLMEMQAGGVDPVDCTGALASARLVKSGRELDLVRAAGRVADDAMSEACRAVRRGSRRCDVAAAALQQQTLAGGRSAIPPIVVQSRHGAHENWSCEELSADDTVRIELAGVVDGYHAPLSRTVVLPGCPPETVRRAQAQHRVLLSALAAGVRALRPGVTADHVYRVMARVLDDNHMSKSSRLGYSFGLGHSPDWARAACRSAPATRRSCPRAAAST